MFGSGFRIPAAAAAVSLLMSSAAGAASLTPPPTAPAATVQPGASWLTLSMLTPAGSIGLAGAAVQPPATPGDYAPPPQAGRGSTTPPIPVIAIWLVEMAVVIYILTKGHHGEFRFPRPNSAG